MKEECYPRDLAYSAVAAGAEVIVTGDALCG